MIEIGLGITIGQGITIGPVPLPVELFITEDSNYLITEDGDQLTTE
jgi:hypothetical protein